MLTSLQLLPCLIQDGANRTRTFIGHTTVEAITAALIEAVEEAAAELRPFDAEAFRSRSPDVRNGVFSDYSSIR